MTGQKCVTRRALSRRAATLALPRVEILPQISPSRLSQAGRFEPNRPSPRIRRNPPKGTPHALPNPAQTLLLGKALPTRHVARDGDLKASRNGLISTLGAKISAAARLVAAVLLLLGVRAD